MKILNVYCGAVGAYFCGRLAQAGSETTITVRSDRALIADKGFEISSIAGDFVFKPHAVLADASEYQDQADYLILTSKVLPAADSVKLIAPAVKPGTVIVLIQNGLGIEEDIARAFPNNELLSAVAYIGVARTAPGIIRHTGAGKLIIGRFGGGESAAGEKLCKLFSDAGVPAEYTSDIAFYRWKKLLWNVPYNAMSVVGGGLLTSEMTDRAEVEALSIKLMQEVVATAHACGVMLPESMVAENVEYTRNFPPYKTSMLVDCENNRPLEVEAIVGSVVKAAHKHQIAIPHLETLYALLKAFDRHQQMLRNTR